MLQVDFVFVVLYRLLRPVLSGTHSSHHDHELEAPMLLLSCQYSKAVSATVIAVSDASNVWQARWRWLQGVRPLMLTLLQRGLLAVHVYVSICKNSML